LGDLRVEIGTTGFTLVSSTRNASSGNRVRQPTTLLGQKLESRVLSGFITLEVARSTQESTKPQTIRTRGDLPFISRLRVSTSKQSGSLPQEEESAGLHLQHDLYNASAW
jgi:hypothetical protein